MEDTTLLVASSAPRSIDLGRPAHVQENHGKEGWVGGRVGGGGGSVVVVGGFKLGRERPIE